MSPVALITGCSGQDGRYLSEYLDSLEYKVYGLVRGQNNPGTDTILSENPNLQILHGDLADQSSLIAALRESKPDEIYHLGAISHVGMSFTQPELTANITGLSTLRLLEAMRIVCPKARFYQASSSEMFGEVRESPQSETTSFYPMSPYGAAKVYAHQVAINYRKAYNLHISCGILFNHESPRRGPEFVTRKVTQAVARIAHNKQGILTLGNTSAVRDWGFAGDYVRAMHAILQQSNPDDYVIATGVPHSIVDLLDLAFAHIGVDDWAPYVATSKANKRPSDVNYLCGDASKARDILGWKPTTTFEELIPIMVDADLALTRPHP